MANIVHLTTVHQPFDTRIFHKECKTLVNAGYHVSLIAQHDKHEIVDGVELIPIPKYQGRIKRILWGSYMAFRLAWGLKADVYHFHDPELMPWGILLALITKARVIYDVHEDYSKKMKYKAWLPKPARILSYWGVKIAERITDKIVNGIITPTEDIEKNFSREKTQVIKNYPIISLLSQKPEQPRTLQDNFELVFTGGYTDQTGIIQIVQALELVKTPQTRLTLLGREIHSYVREEIQALPGYSKVDYKGFVPFEKMYNYLHSAAIGLVCNQPKLGYELALSTKLFEYMSVGLPVIASNFELWKKVVEENKSGIIVDPENPKEIAAAIDQLLQNPMLRKQMGENGVTAIQGKYNWVLEGQKLSSFYQNRILQ